MKANKCECCGAPLKGSKCEYCGMEYGNVPEAKTQISQLELEKARAQSEIYNLRQTITLTTILKHAIFQPYPI